MTDAGRRLRVAMVTSYPSDPAHPRGGVEAVSVNLAAALAAAEDVELHMVTTAPEIPRYEKQPRQNMVIHRLPWAGGKVLTHAIGPGRRQIHRFLQELRPQVVHAHDTYGLHVKGLRLPRVFTAHGFIYADTALAAGRLRKLRAWLWRRFETSGWADQPHLIAISPYVGDHLRKYTRGVIHHIDNPVDERFFRLQPVGLRSHVLYAGHISPAKNTLAVVKAFALIAGEFPGLRLRLAGACRDQAYLDDLKRFIAEQALQDRVDLLGSIDTSAMIGELGRAAALALASLQENAPMVVAEAMAAQVPVVASNRFGIPWMVAEDRSGYLIEPEDPQAIAAALRRIVADPALACRLGCEGRSIARQRFHPASVAAKTIAVYHQACANNDIGKTSW